MVRPRRRCVRWPHDRQGADAARHQGQHHQPRPDRHPNPRQRRSHGGSEGQLYRRGQDPHSARPHWHRRRSRRGCPLSRGRCHLHHRRRTIRRRRLDRPIGPSGGRRSISERLDARQSETSPHSADWRRPQGSDEGNSASHGRWQHLSLSSAATRAKAKAKQKKRPILDKGGVTRQASPMFQGFQFPKTI